MDLIQGQGSSELFQAQSHLYKHILSYVNSMSLKCAVQLGIPDTINNHGQPITLPELVSALQIHPTKTGFVHRLMRLLVHSGFFTTTKVSQKQEEEEAYELTPCSRLLLKDKVPCLSPVVRLVLDPAIVAPWHFLEDWFRKEEVQVPFESTHGVTLWDYADKNREFNDLFNEAMASDSGMMNSVVKDCKPVFEGLSSLVDVGGGTGTLCKIITEAFPQLKCTVLDLPHVVVLHDWNEEECLKILKKCRGAIPCNGKGKVIIIEIVINDHKDEQELTEGKLYFDLMMMAVVTGRERSEKEWKKLFLEAGFTRYKITPIFGLRSLIEVFP
ncbi:O-methyltransferase COMT-type [Trema orientale]|uniref:O-methyltransferase COMT-type n=1 Tax=Trema orientale TaxID=63057 RepID=A0A2P5C7R9_TREOI|nr:O-methyltransferase COMT-type [Trema orientale]